MTAAGIDCRLTGEAVALPADVQSALAWVVREATTNVLRHGDARRCAVGLRVTEGHVVLTVENDGAGASAGEGGYWFNDSGEDEKVSRGSGKIESRAAA